MTKNCHQREKLTLFAMTAMLLNDTLSPLKRPAIYEIVEETIATRKRKRVKLEFTFVYLQQQPDERFSDELCSHISIRDMN